MSARIRPLARSLARSRGPFRHPLQSPGRSCERSSLIRDPNDSSAYARIHCRLRKRSKWAAEATIERALHPLGAVTSADNCVYEISLICTPYSVSGRQIVQPGPYSKAELSARSSSSLRLRFAQIASSLLLRGVWRHTRAFRLLEKHECAHIMHTGLPEVSHSSAFEQRRTAPLSYVFSRALATDPWSLRVDDEADSYVSLPVRDTQVEAKRAAQPCANRGPIQEDLR